jgi:predicted dehydrogenase
MECEDTVAGVMKYSSGCVVSLFASTASVPGFPERIEVSGVKGTAVLSAGRIVVRFADGSGLDEGEEAALGAGADPMAFSHQPHQAVIHNFIEAATGRAEPIASLRSALQVQLLIDALIESSVRNQPLLVKSPS